MWPPKMWRLCNCNAGLAAQLSSKGMCVCWEKKKYPHNHSSSLSTTMLLVSTTILVVSTTILVVSTTILVVKNHCKEWNPFHCKNLYKFIKEIGYEEQRVVIRSTNSMENIKLKYWRNIIQWMLENLCEWNKGFHVKGFVAKIPFP